MSTNRAGAEDAEISPQCWCCGTTEDPARLVRLGNHPEVGRCVRCAHSVSKWAWEIEDRAKTGPLVMARAGFRALRRDVIRQLAQMPTRRRTDPMDRQAPPVTDTDTGTGTSRRRARPERPSMRLECVFRRTPVTAKEARFQGTLDLRVGSKP
jgi:hypothetical protein